ncbi:MAG: hypothetical protein MI863_27885 [Desulfobacterales bacterium]|nr:hypothetical protein [Desulfobacterales bacterium]
MPQAGSKYFIPLLAAAVWNIFFSLLGFFLLPRKSTLFFSTITPQVEFLSAPPVWYAVLTAGIGYGLVGFKNHKFRFFITIGAIGKTALFCFTWYLWFNSVANTLAAMVALGDLMWAIYFLIFLYQTREHGLL